MFNLGYTSNSDRWNLWKMNWRMFKDYPILGIGWEENETRACDYVDCKAIPKPFTGHAHNNYLQELSGLGITGFTAYMCFIIFFLWLTVRLWKRLPKDLYWARALTLGAFGAQIFLHLGGLSECNFKAGATNQNFMIVLGLVASMSVLEAKGLLKKDPVRPCRGENSVTPSRLRLICGILIAIGILARLYGITDPWKTHDHYNFGGVWTTTYAECLKTTPLSVSKGVPHTGCWPGGEINYYQAHPPTILFAMWGWTSVFGSSEAAYRLFIFTFSVLNIFLLFKIAVSRGHWIQILRGSPRFSKVVSWERFTSELTLTLSASSRCSSF